MSNNNEDIMRAAEWIYSADALIIAAGAGMGVDSGLPDFRGKDGFWNAYPALGKQNIQFHDIACPQAFEQTPNLAWGFYGHRLNLYRHTQPHAGFDILKKWGNNLPDGYSVFTSNVDGHFQRACFHEKQIHECHGSIHYLQCTQPCSDDVWPVQNYVPDVDEDACLLRNDPPQCKHCGALARPNILMFGDTRWNQSRVRLQEQRQEKWLSSISRPLVIELGAGTAIPSVRRFSEWIVHRYGGKLIRINPDHHHIDANHGVGLAMPSLAALLTLNEIVSG